jgi:hypothetical protein
MKMKILKKMRNANTVELVLEKIALQTVKVEAKSLTKAKVITRMFVRYVVLHRMKNAIQIAIVKNALSLTIPILSKYPNVNSFFAIEKLNN